MRTLRILLLVLLAPAAVRAQPEADSLRRAAHALYQDGDAARAADLLRQVVDQRVEAHGAESAPAAAAAHDLGLVLHHGGDIDGAQAALEHALALRRTLLAPDHGDLAATLAALSALHRDRGATLADAGLDRLADVVAAWQAYDAALRYADEAHGPDSGASSTLLLDLGRVLLRFGALAAEGDADPTALAHLDMARFADATDRLVAMMEEAAGPDHPTVAGFRLFSERVRLAALTLDGAGNERVALARRLADEAEASGDRAAHAGALARLGRAHLDAGDLDAAEAAFTRALTLREAEGDPLGQADAHGDLGDLHREAGRLADARRAYEQALALAEAALAPDDPALADRLDPLADLLYQLGDRQQAERLTDRIAALEAERYGDAGVEAAVRLADRARFRAGEDDVEAARAYQEEAIARLEAVLDRGAPEPVAALLVAFRGTLGQYLLHLGEETEALRLVAAARDDARERFGPASPTYAHALGTHATVLARTGDLDGAADVRAEALAILEARLGPDHPETAQFRLDLGQLRILQRRVDEAAPLLLDAADAYDRYVRDVLPALSLAEQRAFLASTLAEATSLLLLVSAARPEHLPEAYAFLGGWKGLLLRGVAQQAAAARLSADPEHGPTVARLREVRAEIAALVHEQAGADPATWADARDRLTAEKERLERALAAALPGSALDDPWAGSDVATRLPPGTAFVDVYRHGPRYSAVVTAAGRAPTLVDLGPAEDVDAAIGAWRAAVVRGEAALAEAEALGQAVWRPVARRLPKRTTALWVSSDAALARIPWASLALADDASETLALAEVPSGRALLALLGDPRPAPSGPVLLVGGVDFDAGVGEAVGARWPALPGTQAEVDALAALARETGRAARVLTGAGATPAAVTRALDGAALAHFATHGFFYGDNATPAAVASRTEVLGAAPGVEAGMVRNPLAESGLALAGANAGPAGSLSAEEIVGLDLSGLGLAVLSACETGRGTEVTGQGVLGLQASLLAAGARTLVMSLWKVPDASTALLMEHVYRNLWEAEMPPAAALREAQRAVAADPRFAAPVHWAAWVLAGEGW